VVVLRRYATSWKFVGSTPDQVINFYLNWIQYPNDAVALRLTQPLT
jgi:hypothetical protein